MERDEADRQLAALGDGYDRIAAAMFTLDSHPGLEFLKGSPLAGRTLAAWQSVQPRIDVLWAHFTALRTQLELARGIRGQRSRLGGEELAQLSRMLREPVVTLDPAGMPVDSTVMRAGRAGVTGGTTGGPGWPGAGSGGPGGSGAGSGGLGPPGSSSGLRLTLSQLAQRTESGCAEVTAVLTEVDTACTTLVAGVAPVADRVSEARALANELGEGSDPVFAGLAADLARLRQQALDDPLAAAGTQSGFGAGLRQLAEDADAARTRLAEAARVRDEFPRRVAALRQSVGELATAEATTEQSYQLVGAKIADPGLPPPPAAAPALLGRVPALEQASQPGQSTVAVQWRHLADEMSTLELDVAAAADRARQLREAADGLLGRRNELRGRLEAYRAKAARLGFAEQSELTARHGQARELLYTSPCDLPAATRAVRAYQESLAALTHVQTPGPTSTPEQTSTPEDWEPSR
jgi:hypothetical protein